MEIEAVRHEALRRFIETGKPKGLDADVAKRLLKMVGYLTAIDTTDELHMPPNWGASSLPATAPELGR
jgi:proteic killer suppression protein